MLGKTKILIGDDEEALRRLVSKVLTRRGYDVIEAVDGDEVLQRALRDEPQLILLDVRMPKVDGYAACEQLRQDPRTRDIPIIMLTGADSLESEIQGLRAGADDYLTKPFENQTLIERVTATLPESAVARPPRVLVVDDSSVNLQVMEGYLQATGYDLDLCDNGKDALARAHATPPDAVLLDVQMPGMDGYEVCAALKADPRTQMIPVMFVTANALSDEEMLKGYDVGAVDYLRKPFLRDELVARLQVMVRIKLQQADLERQVNTDALTNLPNRRFLLTRLHEEFSRARRHGHELTVLMLDIDHFKDTNDTYGHEAGDVVLQELGQLMQRAIRTEDTVARYGGEEFIFLLPDTPLDAGLLLAERLREVIASANIEYKGRAVPMTVSIGAANFPMLSIENARELTRYADEALYAAKDAGRNRVQAYYPVPTG